MDRFKLRDKKQWYVRPAIASYILKRSDKKNLKGIQMKIVFGSECCVDGCYKKAKNGQFCKAHFELFDKGEVLQAYYGKSINKKGLVTH